MKRIISLVLVLVSLLTLSVFCFTSCGAVNKSEVSILWSGEGEAKVPDSLINSMERAMYIKNISYKHYGANGDLKLQVEQAKTAVNGGCAVLLVELVQDNVIEGIVAQNAAKDIIDAAKAKNVPVIFFNCDVADQIIESYDKCVLVKADVDTVVEVQAQIIADYVKKNFNKSSIFNKEVKGTDKNKDNKILVLNYGLDVEFGKKVVEKANEILAGEKYEVTRDFEMFGILGKLGLAEYFNLTVELSNDSYLTAKLTDCELILTSDDKLAFDALLKLQGDGYNQDKLSTHFVPIVTVGNTVDYKGYVLANRGEIPEELVKKDDDNSFEINDKNSKIRELFKDYYYTNRFICDLTAVDEYDDMAEMIYTTINVIGDGRIVGTALADNDSISSVVATLTSNFIKNNNTFTDHKVKVRYTSVTVE